jgi:hypothetical protein
MDKASYLLEKIQLPTGYCNISLKPSLVDGLVNPVPSPVSLVDQVFNMVSSSVEPQTQVFNPVPSSISPTLHLKSETQVVDPVLSPIDPTPPLKSEKVVDLVPSLVDPTPPLKSAKVVDLVPPSVDPTPPLKSATKVVNLVPPPVDPIPHSKSEDVAQVYLVNTDSLGQGGTPPILVASPSSNQMIYIGWNHFIEPRLPSYVPFQITMQVCDRNIPNIVIDEGSSIRILSANAWQSFGSPQLAPVTQNLLTFDRRSSQPLGILPQFSITLGGKTVYVDALVVHNPLDFNLLLGRAYVYIMRDFVFTLFRVMCFPHNGNIVTINHLSFIDPHLMVNHPPSLNGRYMSAMSAPTRVNYVTTCPMRPTLHERESLPSLDLDMVVDMVIYLIGILELDIPTLIDVVNMYLFQSVFLPSNEDLLEAMADVCTLYLVKSFVRSRFLTFLSSTLILFLHLVHKLVTTSKWTNEMKLGGACLHPLIIILELSR